MFVWHGVLLPDWATVNIGVRAGNAAFCATEKESYRNEVLLYPISSMLRVTGAPPFRMRMGFTSGRAKFLRERCDG
jgi:hypothetical protein